MLIISDLFGLLVSGRARWKTTLRRRGSHPDYLRTIIFTIHLVRSGVLLRNLMEQRIPRPLSPAQPALETSKLNRLI